MLSDSAGAPFRTRMSGRMTIKHRIQRLEDKHLPSKQRTYVIVSNYGEPRDEAKQRYCQEKNITEADLEVGRVFQIVYVSPGDI